MVDDLPCIPDMYDAPSKKVRTLARGTLFVPANTGGFITFFAFGGAARDCNSINYCDATYTYDGIAPTFSTTGVVEQANIQAPYTIANIGPGLGQVQNRLVAAGLRVRYIGTELNRGGMIVPFRHPENQPFTGYHLADMLAYQETRQAIVNREWHGINYVPTNAVQYQYSTATIAVNQNPGYNGSLGIYIENSGANVSVPYQWEAVAYYEYTGATDGKTVSHSDLNGMSAVRSFLEGGLDGDPTTGLYQEAKNIIGNLTPKDISGFVSVGQSLAGALF